MKTISAFLVLSLVSISTFACPSIQGTWTCGENTEPQNIEVVKQGSEYNLVLTDKLDSAKPVKSVFVVNNQDQKIESAKNIGFCYKNQVVAVSNTEVIHRYVLFHPGALVLQQLKLEEGKLMPASKGVNCKRAYPSI